MPAVVDLHRRAVALLGAEVDQQPAQIDLAGLQRPADLVAGQGVSKKRQHHNHQRPARGPAQAFNHQHEQQRDGFAATKSAVRQREGG